MLVEQIFEATWRVVGYDGERASAALGGNDIEHQRPRIVISLFYYPGLLTLLDEARIADSAL